MARTDTLTNYLTDVATAIKNKKGSQTPIQASAFDTEIANLPSGGGGPDWTQIGYTGTPQSITNGFNYAKDIYDNWDSSSRNYYQLYKSDTNLLYFPSVPTNTWSMQEMFYSNKYIEYVGPLQLCSDCRSMFNGCTNLRSVGPLQFPTSGSTIQAISMFYGCTNLKSVQISGRITMAKEMFIACRNLEDVPVLNISYMSGTNNHQDMFGTCFSLTDTSLDNILQSCISATNISGNKTLAYMGINNTTYYPASRIEALPHYQDFVNAGWTIS